ncbi:MAG: MATE family efflux transporter [Firmicutes bacterium]|nr:MATE family efflux transporter [Bacillota bacterium]
MPFSLLNGGSRGTPSRSDGITEETGGAVRTSLVSYREVWTLAWPVIAEMALQTVSSVVDMAMVGRLGAAQVAAVGLTFHPVFLVMAVFMGIAVGTTALVARFVGAGFWEEAGGVTRQSLLLAVALGLFTGLLGYLLAEPVVRWMGASPEVTGLGASYLRWSMPGLVFLFIFNILTGALRGAGDMKTPLKVNIVLNLFKVAANYPLIFGVAGWPGLALDGAALSTTLARGVGTLALLIMTVQGQRTPLRLDPGQDWRPDLGLIRRIMNIGLPAAGERIITSLGQVLFARMVAGLGTVIYAAHSIGLNVESFSYMPGMGFATAATTMVGQRLGAGRGEEAAQTGWGTLRLALVVMGSMGALFFLFPRQFMGIYTADAAVIGYGIQALRIVAFSQIPEGAGFVLSGALRGAGDTRYVLNVTIIGMWLVRLGLTYLFIESWGWGLAGAWVAMTMDWVVRAVLLFLRFRGAAWRRIKV